MDSLLKYKIYFENIARALNSISHTDDEEHFESIQSSAWWNGVQFRIADRGLFLEDYSSSFRDNQGTLSKTTSGAFAILKQVDGSSDYAKQTEAVAWAEAECMKVLAKIRYDKTQRLTDVMGFDFNTVEFLPMHNMPQGWFGMRVSFNVPSVTSLCFDGNDWLGDADLVMPCKNIGEYTAAELLTTLSEEQLNGIMAEQNVLLLGDGDLIEIE